MSGDIILVTIDCWRDDAYEAMPQLRKRTREFTRGSAICQAPATRGAFPALLAGRYYPQAYTDYDTLRDGIESLPELLAEEGYATGAVVGSNPFLSAWESHFEYFWNDEMDFGAAEDGQGWLSGPRSTIRDAISFATVRSRVTTGEVAARARKWYERQESPRFLWVHLMDVHVPFLPGLRRGLSAGLLDTYRTHLRFKRDPGGLLDSEYDQLENLYWQSVDFLDEQLQAIFEIDDDAAMVVTADHGEEFDHDEYGHARLYDECIRVPLVVSPELTHHLGNGSIIRQLDIPAGILSAVGREPPDDWIAEGPPDGDVWPAFSVNHSPNFERVYAAVRTERYKLIETFEESMGEPVRTELYDLEADPDERTDRAGDHPEQQSLTETLHAFLARPDVERGILERHRTQSPAVEERLDALGYK